MACPEPDAKALPALPARLRAEPSRAGYSGDMEFEAAHSLWQTESEARKVAMAHRRKVQKKVSEGKRDRSDRNRDKEARTGETDNVRRVRVRGQDEAQLQQHREREKDRDRLDRDRLRQAGQLIEDQRACVKELRGRLAIALQEAVARESHPSLRAQLRESGWDPQEIEAFVAWGWVEVHLLLIVVQHAVTHPPDGKMEWATLVRAKVNRGEVDFHSRGIWICEHGTRCESCSQLGNRNFFLLGNIYDCDNSDRNELKDERWLLEAFPPGGSGAWARECHSAIGCYADADCGYRALSAHRARIVALGVECGSVTGEEVVTLLAKRRTQAAAVNSVCAANRDTDPGVQNLRSQLQEYEIGNANSFRVLTDGGSLIRIISDTLHCYGNLHRLFKGSLFQSCAKPRVVPAVVEAEGGSNKVDDSSERQIELYSTVEISEMYANEIERPAQSLGRTTLTCVDGIVVDGNARMGEPMSEHSDDDAHVSWCDY
jgi:hypothetical protein